MNNNDDIPTTDAAEIKQLINRFKQGKLDQGDALLIEKLLDFLLTIVSLLQQKHTSIRRMKELLFGMKEKKRGTDEVKNRAGESRSGAGESSQMMVFENHHRRETGGPRASSSGRERMSKSQLPIRQA